METEQRIVNAMKAGEEEKVCRWMDEVIDENYSRRDLTSRMKKYLLFELLGTVMKGAGQEEAETLFPRFSMERDLQDGMEAEAAKAYFHSLAERVCISVRKREEETRADEQFGRQVMAYVQEHFQDPDLNISLTALHFQITPSYLSSLFKEQTGMNLLEYINHTRVEKVKELLKQGMSVVDICELTGFRNSGALIRVFKKETGITPGQMKKLQN